MIIRWQQCSGTAEFIIVCTWLVNNKIVSEKQYLVKEPHRYRYHLVKNLSFIHSSLIDSLK